MRMIFKILILFFVYSLIVQASQMNIHNLRCEYKPDPLGVDVENPRLSWNLESNQRGVKQTAYQLFVASSLEILDSDKADIWNSGKIASDKSIQIYYEGNLLESNNKYFWKVKVWDQNNKPHTSEWAFWTTGLFKSSDWKASWIGLDKAVGDDDPDTPKRKLSARMLRR